MPVEKSAALTRRNTGSDASPTDAARPISCARSRVPASRIVLPARMSSPVRRIHSPGLGACFTITSSPAASHCSCVTTASAPGGIGAPVKMRAAVPGSSGLPIAPAGMRCATRSRAAPDAQSAARTA